MTQSYLLCSAFKTTSLNGLSEEEAKSHAEEKGYGKVYIFYGGWVDWQSANYPVESGYDQN